MRVILAVFVLLFAGMASYAAAQLMMGGPAEQISIDVMMGQDGAVHVVHRLAENRQPATLELVAGVVSNITVRDQDGNDFEYGTSGSGNTTSITLFTPNDGLVVEYDLQGVLLFEDGMWGWDYRYYIHPRSVFHIPEGADLVFVNGNPVPMIDTNKLGCNGCDMILEYVIGDNTETFSVTRDGADYDIPIRSLADISDVRLDSSALSFEVDRADEFVIVRIPDGLLAGPYRTYFNDELILRHEFLEDDTGVSLSMRPNASGTVRITGADHDGAMAPATDNTAGSFDEVDPVILAATIGAGLAATILITLRYRHRLTAR